MWIVCTCAAVLDVVFWVELDVALDGEMRELREVDMVSMIVVFVDDIAVECGSRTWD